jgi:dihydroxyacetone kinase-like protein
MELTLERAVAWMHGFGDQIRQNKELLTGLDAAIGDADHGINMDRGFAAVRQKLDAASAADLGTLFRTVGSTLISTVGGASGPLYGTAFLRMSGALTGKATVGAPELGAALAAAYEGMAARGKSGRGEKTLLDAFGPAVDAFQAVAAQGQSLPDAVAAAVAAAAAGATATIPLVATKGRASFLGAGSAGHQDPGATSTALLFQALAASLSG